MLDAEQRGESMECASAVASDGHRLDLYLWRPQLAPDQTPRGVLHVLHGMAEHARRYDWFATRMAELGWLVVAHDHRGHGPGAHACGELGQFPEAGYRRVVADVGDVAARIDSLLPETERLPHVLFGHSMGSLVARLAALDPRLDLTALVLSGTVGPLLWAPAGVAVARARVRMRGAHTPSPALDRLTTAGYLRKIPAPRTRADWISRDRSHVDAYLNDPLSGFVLSARFYRELARMSIAANSPRAITALSHDLPVLFVAGDGDPVGDYGAGVRTVAERMRRAGVCDVTTTIYAGARHELLNETNREDVLADIVAFLDRVTS